jgi:hypothetical protein
MARLRVTCCALVALAAACGDALGPTVDFLENRARWDRRGPATYTYDFHRICFCLTEAVEPVRITVTSGVVTAVVRVADGQPIPPEQVNLFFRVTIDSLFVLIGDAIENDAHAIDVAYDAYWGYPTNTFIDYLANAIDEEQGFTAALQAP